MNRKTRRIAVAGLSAALLTAAVGGSALAKSASVTAQLDYTNITITMDDVTIDPKDVNGKSTEPFAIDGTTYLPVRALCEAMGWTVEWDASTNTVKISTSGVLEVKAVCDGSATYKIAAEERDFKMGFDGNYFLDDYFGTDIQAGVEALIEKGGVTINDRPATIDEVTQTLKSSGTNITLTVENGAAIKMELFSTAGILIDEVQENDDGTVTVTGDGNDLTVPAGNVASGVEPYTVCVYWEGADGMHIQPADKLTGKLVKSDDHAGVIINIDGEDVTFAGADMYQRGASAGNRPGGYANTTDRLDLEEYELTAWLIPGTKDTDNPMIIAFTTGTPEKASARLQKAIDYAQGLVDMTVIAESAEDAATETDLKEYHWLKPEDTAVLDGLKQAISAAKAALADESVTAQEVDDTAYDIQIAVWGSNSDVSAVFTGSAIDGYFDKADGGEHALPAAVLY